MLDESEIVFAIEYLKSFYPDSQTKGVSLETYVDGLADINPIALRFAVTKIAKKSTFFPRVSEIRAVVISEGVITPGELWENRDFIIRRRQELRDRFWETGEIPDMELTNLKRQAREWGLWDMAWHIGETLNHMKVILKRQEQAVITARITDGGKLVMSNA